MKKRSQQNGHSEAGGAAPLPENIIAELEGKSRVELYEIIVSLRTVEPLFSAQQVALRSKMNVRDVRKAINEGKLGGGFFCWGANSKKVSASAVNAWRQSFFVSVRPPVGV
jgi:hypothetical protein